MSPWSVRDPLNLSEISDRNKSLIFELLVWYTAVFLDRRSMLHLLNTVHTKINKSGCLPYDNQDIHDIEKEFYKHGVELVYDKPVERVFPRCCRKKCSGRSGLNRGYLAPPLATTSQ
jgi:hypothetical protein